MTGILVPFDGSKESLKALHIACDLADKYQSSVNLVYVIKAINSADGNAEPDLTAKNNAKKILHVAYMKIKNRGINIGNVDFEYGDTSNGILLAAKRCKASTIVMGCRGIKNEDETNNKTGDLFGTVSQKVFQQATCTCISVK